MSDAAARFEAACREWQARFGLLDWAFRFEVVKSPSTKHAEVNMDHEIREAIFTFYTSGKPVYTPERLALHECLHVVLVEVLEVTAQRACITHRDVEREEHRAIERLTNVIGGKE